jgi:3-methyladenine DNA glycosylase AlkD
MTPEAALGPLRAEADADRAAQMRAYHKADRPYLGLPNGRVTDLATAWRKALDLPGRIALAQGLWASDIFEARIAAAKLFLQARIRPDDTPPGRACRFRPDFDSWAIADAVAQAGQKRLSPIPSRLDEVEGWTTSDHMWTRRAALVFTLGFAKSRHPKAAEPRRGTASSAGARPMPTTRNGSSRKASPGGCVTCRRRTRSARRRFSRPTARG